MTPGELQAALERFLARETGSAVRLSPLEPLAGGASRAAYALDIEVSGGPRRGTYRAVLRIDGGGEIYTSALSRPEEAALLENARRGGVRVPRVYWSGGEESGLGRGFLILERIEGETLGRRIVTRPEFAEARRVLPQAMGTELARIHAVDPDALPFLPGPRPGESAAQAALRRAAEELERIDEPHPALEIARRWLEEHAPPPGDLVLVHGDFRLGNMVVGEEGLRAVLDWEFSAVGDPHEDLAWPFVRDWRFGNDHLRFAGIANGEEFLETYARYSGRTPDPAALRYWEILGNFRWAVGCLTQARRHLEGAERSIELASLGRRAAEMELEVLELIEAAERSGGA